MRWPGTPARCWRPGGTRTGARPGAGRGTAGRGDRAVPGAVRGRGVPDRPAGRPGPGAVDGGPADPARDKTAARGFDGCKGHVAVDPDAEIITATAVTPGNSGDAEAAAGGQAAVYGDAACGSGELIARLDDAGIGNGIKCQPPAVVTGHFPKDP
jgi:hypothetical protein